MERDVATSILQLNNELTTLPPPFHTLEKYGKYPGAHNTGSMLLSTKPEKDWVILEVYMDDFLAHTQRIEANHQITSAILHGMQSVFVEPDVTVHI
jgi:hypothetical protein